jgi:hypothetical protein
VKQLLITFTEQPDNMQVAMTDFHSKDITERELKAACNFARGLELLTKMYDKEIKEVK